MFIGVVVLQITPAKNGKPVQIELVDTKTKEVKETLEVIVLLTYAHRVSFRCWFSPARLTLFCSKFLVTNMFLIVPDFYLAGGCGTDCHRALSFYERVRS